MRKNYRKNTSKKTIPSIVISLIVLINCFFYVMQSETGEENSRKNTSSSKSDVQITETAKTGDSDVNVSNVPAYTDSPTIELNNNEPEFTEYEVAEASTSYLYLSELDSLGRCGKAEASLSTDTLATEKRGDISSVHPSGWHNEAYTCVNTSYVYNRSHLLMYAASGILDDNRNLITGTRYMNEDGMLPYEEKVVNYIRSTGNHVLYRVTPIYDSDNLVASGVQMEAESVEDSGKGLRFNIYCYNVQPGVNIDYATGYTEGTAACPIK